MNPIYYFVFSKKTLFIPLKALYPECSVYITEHTSVNNLQCLSTSCPVDKNCMGKLVPRVSALFDQDKDVKMIVAYFKERNSQRIRAGVFTRDLSEPGLVTCNPFALKKFQKEGVVYQWFPHSDFFTKEHRDLISPESLIR